MEQATRVREYLQALERLEAIQRKHQDADSVEEDSWLDHLDVLWFAMTPEEQEVAHNGRLEIS